MEALLFMFNSMAIVVMVFMGLRDDKAPPGTPHTSIFRMRDRPVPAKSAATPEVREPGWADWNTPP